MELKKRVIMNEVVSVSARVLYANANASACV